jgi:hypothetical protein
LEYVKSQPVKERLFPGLKRDTRETLTGNWSKWFGRYLRKTMGITEKRKVFHSFRHTFKDACRRARIATEVHNAVTGHAGQSVADNYGGEYPLEVLVEAIQKISYPAVGELGLTKWLPVGQAAAKPETPQGVCRAQEVGGMTKSSRRMPVASTHT